MDGVDDVAVLSCCALLRDLTGTLLYILTILLQYPVLFLFLWETGTWVDLPRPAPRDDHT